MICIIKFLPRTIISDYQSKEMVSQLIPYLIIVIVTCRYRRKSCKHLSTVRIISSDMMVGWCGVVLKSTHILLYCPRYSFPTPTPIEILFSFEGFTFVFYFVNWWENRFGLPPIGHTFNGILRNPVGGIKNIQSSSSSTTLSTTHRHLECYRRLCRIFRFYSSLDSSSFINSPWLTPTRPQSLQ